MQMHVYIVCDACKRIIVSSQTARELLHIYICTYIYSIYIYTVYKECRPRGALEPVAVCGTAGARFIVLFVGSHKLLAVLFKTAEVFTGWARYEPIYGQRLPVYLVTALAFETPTFS